MNWQQRLPAWGKLSHNTPLAPRTTLGIGGPARWWFTPNDVHGLRMAMRALPMDIAILPLGRGSNMLISDQGFDGLVVDTGALRQYRREETVLHAGAGIRMNKLAQHAAQAGLSGIEFMATVPGDVGGGVAMNAGAFGQQWSDVLHRVHLVRRDGELCEYPASELEMSYRRTRLPKYTIVVEAELRLRRDDAEAVRQRMRDMRRRRKASQPLEQPNCGSVFKNPPGEHAARLIEAAGLKGQRIGQAQISPMHANFIVNHGQARAKDVLALIRLARDTVGERFGIWLEPEVCMLGLSL